jgi:hypothetical protein
MSELEARTENRHLRDMVYGLEQKIFRLTAERDRLQKERDEIELELCQRAEKWEAERDRLLAALGRIRDFYEPGQEGETTHQDIARRALEGK